MSINNGAKKFMKEILIGIKIHKREGQQHSVKSG